MWNSSNGRNGRSPLDLIISGHDKEEGQSCPRPKRTYCNNAPSYAPPASVPPPPPPPHQPDGIRALWAVVRKTFTVTSLYCVVYSRHSVAGTPCCAENGVMHSFLHLLPPTSTTATPATSTTASLSFWAVARNLRNERGAMTGRIRPRVLVARPKASVKQVERKFMASYAAVCERFCHLS